MVRPKMWKKEVQILFAFLLVILWEAVRNNCEQSWITSCKLDHVRGGRITFLGNLWCFAILCHAYDTIYLKLKLDKKLFLLFNQLPPLFVFVFVFLLVSHSISHCINNDHLLFVYCHFVGVHNCFNLWLQVVPQVLQVHSHQKVTRETVRQLLLFQKLTLMGKKMLTCDFFSLLRETTRPSPQETRSGVSNWRTAPWVLLSEVFSCLPYIC